MTKEIKDKLEEAVEDVKGFFETLKEKAKIDDGIPDDVRRSIYKFYSGLEKGDKARAINDGKRAYLSMKEKLDKSAIPPAEKEGIEKNLNNMYPGNYVKQNAEVQSMIDTVLYKVNL